MDSKAETITKATEFFYWNGNKIDGAYKTSDPDMVFIRKDALKSLLETQVQCEQLKKRETAHMQEIMSGKVESSNNAGTSITSDADYAKFLSAKATVKKNKKKRETDALVIACSILGYSTADIQEEFAKRGLHCSIAKVSRAISVSNEGDKGRIEALMKDYPDYFLNVSDTLFERWYSKRLEKCHKKSEWGE